MFEWLEETLKMKWIQMRVDCENDILLKSEKKNKINKIKNFEQHLIWVRMEQFIAIYRSIMELVYLILMRFTILIIGF